MSKRSGAVLGTFGTYYRERREPSAREIEGIGRLAVVAARALERGPKERTTERPEERPRER